MERRLLLAIVLTFVVLTAYQWLVPTGQPVAPGSTAAPGVSQAAKQAATASTPPAPAPPPATAAATPAPTPAVEAVRADTAERTVTVDNGVVRAVFSNRGATLA